MSTDYLAPSQPDILEVIANLSNDAVFTPPRVVNAVLDLLPAEVWSDPTLRWLDPGAKTGVFPREITKRLMAGLAEAIPDETARLEHILREMVFAIATEEITGMMTRRSLYCSKDASSEFSTVRFADPDGNVWRKRVKHDFDIEGRCKECKGTRADLEMDERDNKAYGFIHADGRQKIDKEITMKFDVIVGNPPYQMETGGSGRQAVPLYHKFVEQAQDLNPQYLAMVIPSRWFGGGMGLDAFRTTMLADRRVRHLVDYLDARECFPGVDIAGGVCYFLWSRDDPGTCEVENRWGNKTWHSTRHLDEFDVFVRLDPAVSIVRKVVAMGGESLTSTVSGVRPFGIPTSQRPQGTSGFHLLSSGGRGYIPKSMVSSGHQMVDKWKVITSKTSHDHAGQPDKDGMRRVLSRLELLEPGWVCTESYIVLGAFDTKAEAENLLGYARTAFLRFLVSVRSYSQDITRDRFAFVPLQDFSKEWTDAELYKKYGITADEQAFIESMIKEMAS
jgi:site-specific DNA-methyltransferase (adenine-specific)